MEKVPRGARQKVNVVRYLLRHLRQGGTISEAKKAMQLDPGYYRTHFWLGRVYAQKHMYKEAIAESEIVLKATPDSNLALTEMAYSLAAAGRQAESRKFLRRLEERAKNGFVPAYD